MKKPSQRYVVFMGDLEEQSIRETCIGAAEYVAGKSHLNFEPWPLYAKGDERPRPQDLRETDGLLATLRAFHFVFGRQPRPPFPCVLTLSSDSSRYASTVGVDEEMIGQMAAQHLIDRGYSNLACVFPSKLNWADLRMQSFRLACRKAGIICSEHEFSQEAVPIFWRANFKRRHQELFQLIKDLPKPCGIFAVNDVIACFLIETARFHGFRVPQDVGIIGVDDDPVPNAAAGMSISSIQLPFQEVGRRAAMLLEELRKKKQSHRRIILPPVRVVVRASTDIFMVQNKLIRQAQAYIEQNRSRSLRVQEVVRELKTTTVTLGKHFSRHLHMTPSEYILLRRIEYAKELLRAHKLNVEQISQTCDFHSCSYFCKIFKRLTGTSPGSFRSRTSGV